jgi:hypothetical protein
MNDDRTINKSGIIPDRTTTVGLIMTALMCTFVTITGIQLVSILYF